MESKAQILNLIKTGEVENISLAFELSRACGYEIDISPCRYVYDYLKGFKYVSRVETDIDKLVQLMSLHDDMELINKNIKTELVLNKIAFIEVAN